MLFRRYQGDLLRFLTRRVSCPETAADIAQESFLRLMRLARVSSRASLRMTAAGRHRPPAQAAEIRDVRAFLFTTAANLARDHQRHARVARPAANSDSALAGMADPAPTVETQAIDRDQLARAIAAMDALPERTRIAFEMHRLGGYTQTEIARELGVSVTLVWRMIHRAYAEIRDSLRDGEDAEDGR